MGGNRGEARFTSGATERWLGARLALAILAGTACGVPDPPSGPLERGRSALTTWTSTGGQHLDAPGVAAYEDDSHPEEYAYSIDPVTRGFQYRSILGARPPGWVLGHDIARMRGSPTVVRRVDSDGCRTIFLRRNDSTLAWTTERLFPIGCEFDWHFVKPFTNPSPMVPGAVVIGSPAAAGWGNPGSPLSYQRFDVFARGAGDHLLWITATGPVNNQGFGLTFSPWRVIDSVTLAAGTDPAVVSTAEGELDLFLTLTDQALWTIHLDAVTGWGAWTSLGGVLTSGPGATGFATPGGGKRLDVVARGRSGGYGARTYFDPTLAALQGVAPGWQPWRECGGSFTSKPAVTYSAGGQQADLLVFGKGPDDAIWTGVCNPAPPLPPPPVVQP